MAQSYGQWEGSEVAFTLLNTYTVIVIFLWHPGKIWTPADWNECGGVDGCIREMCWHAAPHDHNWNEADWDIFSVDRNGPCKKFTVSQQTTGP